MNCPEGQRKAGFYPGMVSNILESSGQSYLDPFEDFATELLRLSTERSAKGSRPRPTHSSTVHSATATSRLWAAISGPRPSPNGSACCSATRGSSRKSRTEPPAPPRVREGPSPSEWLFASTVLFLRDPSLAVAATASLERRCGDLRPAELVQGSVGHAGGQPDQKAMGPLQTLSP